MTRSPASKLKVRFDDPDDGWVGFTVAVEDRTATIVVSYTPNDLFVDLIDAMTRLQSFAGDIQVISFHGANSFAMHFTRHEKDVQFSIDSLEQSGSGQTITRLFEFSGQVNDVVIPFWRSLRDLQGRFSAGELTRRWHRPFPWDDIDQLTCRLTRTDTDRMQ